MFCTFLKQLEGPRTYSSVVERRPSICRTLIIRKRNKENQRLCETMMLLPGLYKQGAKTADWEGRAEKERLKGGKKIEKQG